MNFEDELMDLEERAGNAGVERSEMISAYELRKMALEEMEADAEDDGVADDAD